MARFFMGALVFCACGKVAEVPDAMQADAALDALTCASPMTECAAACVDTSTDEKNCGGCGIACQAGASTCQAGVCVDTIATCADFLAGNPNASDGVYTLLDGTVLDCDLSGRTCAQMLGSNANLPSGTYTKTDGTTIDCDMQDGGLQVIGVGWGLFSAVTPGWALITLSDFQTPILQQFFIKYYNQQKGATLIAQWTQGDCCFRYDNVGTDTLNFGANTVQPMTTAGATQCGADTFGTLEAFYLCPNGSCSSTTQVAELAPLDSTLFTTYPAQNGTQCSTPNANPGFFWQVMP
jgi:hypothetical protein